MRTLIQFFLGCVLFLGLCTTSYSGDYNRDEWLPRWSDFDRDCQNTRQELLIRFSMKTVSFTDNTSRRRCTVEYGLWFDPYTGLYYTKATDVDIEHVVPLKWAEDHGGALWPAAKKRRFAEDPDNLWVVSAKYNREKGALGPDRWLPPYRPTRAYYLASFAAIVEKYDLTLSEKERRVLYLH